MTTWAPEMLTRLRELHAIGLEPQEIADSMKLTRPAVASAIARHIHGRMYRAARTTPRERFVDSMWTEERLTESWAQRKARRALETVS
jgi:hypothetical protein